MKKTTLLLFLLGYTVHAWSQSAIDEDQLGAWYMYFFTKKFENSQFGIQGDYQFRSWNLGSDREQLLLRTGLTYKPKNAEITFTAGYAFISSGSFGESGISVQENRIYQEALFPQKIGGGFYLIHRLRFEQRWIENQDLRTRYRYNLFLNIPLNRSKIEKSALYLALYNEIFLNGQQEIGNGMSVPFFDRNRTYLGLGYGVLDNLRIQTGFMKQTTSEWAKGQMQFSVHHSF